MRDRLLWLLSLVFVAWMVWAETSFQFFGSSLGDQLRLSETSVAMIGGAFLVPYGLAQIPVGWLLDHGRAERLLLLGSIGAAVLAMVFGRGQSMTELLISRAAMGLACSVAFPASGLLARKTLPAHRFPLAMGATDSLLGFGAAFAALMPLLLHGQTWRSLLLLQSIMLMLLVVLPLLLLQASSLKLFRPVAIQSDPASLPSAEFELGWSGSSIRQVIHAALMYAWGAGVLFGLGQYGLLSSLEGWSHQLKLGISFALSIATAAGMLIAGWLGSSPSRRRALLLIGTCSAAVALLVLTLNQPRPAEQLVITAVWLGLALGSCVLSFPMAEAAAPPGRTAFVVALVNTAGTLSGAFMTFISGWLLKVSLPGDTRLVIVTYGALAVAGIVCASWPSTQHGPIRISSEHPLG